MNKQAIAAILNSKKISLFDPPAIAANPFNGSIIDAVIHYFTLNDWSCDREEVNLLHSNFQIDGDRWDCYIQSFEEQSRLLVYSILPVIATRDTLAAILELTARINYETAIGSFDVDCDTGFIAYKTSIDIKNSHLDLALIRNLLQANTETLVYYLPAFRAIIEGKNSPLEVITHYQK